MQPYKIAALVPIALLTAACASAGGRSGQSAGLMRISLGASQNATDVGRIANTTLRHHQYEIAETTGSAAFYYGTHWKNRVPFDDESALGVQTAQTKIVVQGNTRMAAGIGQVLMVEMIAQNRVKTKDGNDWTTVAATKAYKDYINGIAEEMKRELDTGIKIY